MVYLKGKSARSGGIAVSSDMFESETLLETLVYRKEGNLFLRAGREALSGFLNSQEREEKTVAADSSRKYTFAKRGGAIRFLKLGRGHSNSRTSSAIELREGGLMRGQTYAGRAFSGGHHRGEVGVNFIPCLVGAP